MLHNTYAGQECSVARTLELVGERWTFLILRDAFLGVRRFDDFQRSLGIARNVLHTRLQRLCEADLLERRRYQERPERFEYHLTPTGRDLWPALLALMEFGDKHLAPQGPPVVLTHRHCGGMVSGQRICADCGGTVEVQDVRWERGPGTTEVKPVAPVAE